MRVSADMPDDVHVLHDALELLQEYKQRQTTSNNVKQAPLVLNLKNCGTALRFLQVHIAQCYPGESITLDGDPRLKERDGKPTSQTTSALILHGKKVPVEKDESPYITMSRRLVETYPNIPLEADLSAAAFWYEYIAIHGGELLLDGLNEDSLQGDKVVADIYAKYFGVETKFVNGGVEILKSSITNYQSPISIDFSHCPDLYPAIALTCEKLSIELHASGIERLRFKESDRIEAVQRHEVRNDHRMAMALMAADFKISKDEQTCISKSYPEFVEQITATTRQRHDNDTATNTGDSASISHITPQRGINDDNLGKKHALSKLIRAVNTEYVWLHDDDIVRPKACTSGDWRLEIENCDLIILPLKMESENAKPSLLERLQIAEYAAIQELTMRTAKRGQAVMCSGANLIVKRTVWLECEGELHPEIPSGDDMFLLEAGKRRGYRIGVIDEPDYTAIVRPLTSWRSFFCQRMRWAGKAPKYTDKDIIRCGTWVIAINLLQILCPPIILIKFPIEYSLIKKREPRTSWYVALLLEILYPFYILISLFGGLFSRRAW